MVPIKLKYLVILQLKRLILPGIDTVEKEIYSAFLYTVSSF